jgi:hypothetical protein
LSFLLSRQQFHIDRVAIGNESISGWLIIIAPSGRISNREQGSEGIQLRLDNSFVYNAS